MFKGIFGNKPAPASAPAAPASATAAPAPVSSATAAPGTIKDVTLRPVVLGIDKTLTMVSNPSGKGKVISPQVSPDQFNKYTINFN